MKLMICSSMQFAQEILQAKEVLKELGHEVMIPSDTHECIKNSDLNIDLEYCLRTNIDKKDFDQVASSEGIVVLNYPKNNIKGYIGGATLMEIGIARYLGKKIFLLYDLPSEDDLRYALEVKITRPIVLDGDLRNITKHLKD